MFNYFSLVISAPEYGKYVSPSFMRPSYYTSFSANFLLLVELVHELQITIIILLLVQCSDLKISVNLLSHEVI